MWISKVAHFLHEEQLEQGVHSLHEKQIEQSRVPSLLVSPSCTVHISRYHFFFLKHNCLLISPLPTLVGSWGGGGWQ